MYKGYVDAKGTEEGKRTPQLTSPDRSIRNIAVGVLELATGEQSAEPVDLGLGAPKGFTHIQLTAERGEFVVLEELGQYLFHKL